MSAYCKNLKICGGDAFGDSVRSVYIEDLTQWLNMDGDLWLYSTCLLYTSDAADEL